MGSTGTRLNIYEFQNRKIVKFFNFENGPGLSELSDNQIQNKIMDLIEQAEIEIKDLKKIPIGVYGTAGLRSLPFRESNHKLNFIKNLLRDFNLIECRIISGREEGEMAFNSLIYFKNDKQNNTYMGKILRSSFLKNIKKVHYALIDMGGKSVQIVYDKNNKRIYKSYVAGYREALNHISRLDCTILKKMCIRRIADTLGNINEIDTSLNNKQIYLSSYFYDVIRKNIDKPLISLKSLMKIFDNRCKDLGSNECKDLFYIVGFLKRIGVSPYKKMHLIGYVEGIRFNWSIGKSYQILNNISKE